MRGTTPVRATTTAPATPPTATAGRRQGGSVVFGAPLSSPSDNNHRGGPRQRPSPAEHVLASPSPTQLAMRTSALAESLLEEARLDLLAKRDLESDVLFGVRQQLRDLAVQLDQDNWMYSKPMMGGGALKL